MKICGRTGRTGREKLLWAKTCGQNLGELGEVVMGGKSEKMSGQNPWANWANWAREVGMGKNHGQKGAFWASQKQISLPTFTGTKN